MNPQFLLFLQVHLMFFSFLYFLSVVTLHLPRCTFLNKTEMFSRYLSLDIGQKMAAEVYLWLSSMCENVDNFIWDLLSCHLADLNPLKTNHRDCLEQMSKICSKGNTWRTLSKTVGSEVMHHCFYMQWHVSPVYFHFRKGSSSS